MDAGTADAIVYLLLAALGCSGVALVVWALLFMAPRSPRRRTRPLPAFPPPTSEPIMPNDQHQALTATLDANPIETPADLPAPAPGDRTSINDYPLLAAPHVCLAGPVDHAMYATFRDHLSGAPADGPTVIALSTLGGDPEVARLMGDEIRLLREAQGRDFLFLGKVAVYSAGATFMAAFPNDKRFLTRGTRIMIHERNMTKTIQVSGPLKTCIANLKANLHEIEHSIRIEEEGFRKIVEGSKVDFEELVRRAPENWYIEAEEARELGLILDVI